jgi:hypothetical protein
MLHIFLYYIDTTFHNIIQLYHQSYVIFHIYLFQDTNTLNYMQNKIVINNIVTIIVKII